MDFLFALCRSIVIGMILIPVAFQVHSVRIRMSLEEFLGCVPRGETKRGTGFLIPSREGEAVETGGMILPVWITEIGLTAN